MTVESSKNHRYLTPHELGALVKTFRAMRQWSPEQLGDISSLNLKTIQRIEDGKPSSLDSRRALARAFGCEDLDAFYTPYVIPTEDDLKALKAKFDRENFTLPTQQLATGKRLADLAELTSTDMCTSAVVLTREAEKCFAALIYIYRFYRDCSHLYSQSGTFGIHDMLQERIDSLKALGTSIFYATSATMLYLDAVPLGRKPEVLTVPRTGPTV